MQLVEAAATKTPFHILALSGGGYKGLYTAEIIALIEERTGKPFGSHFNLICGTSIGGILALALASREISARTVVEKLMAVGPEVFRPVELPKQRIAKPTAMAKKEADKRIYELSGFTIDRGVIAAKHDSAPLKVVLQEIFEDRKIEDLKTRVLVPTVNWTKGGPQFFKTPHHPRFTLDGKRALVDVAMATSAAPIYLPNYEFEHQVYVDGGLVGNAPGIFGVHEAEHSVDEEVDRGDIYLLSIGALSSRITANQSETLNKGLAQWNSRIFDLMMACQEQTANFMLEQKMGDRYCMIDSYTSADQDKVVALDKAGDAATSTLLGLAKTTFQEEIAKESRLGVYLRHQAPELNFKSSKELSSSV